MRGVCSWLLLVVVSLAVVVAGVSCTSQRLGYDHRQMRTELLTAYEEQLMDNLIRAREGLPLLQIKYGVIDGSSKTNMKLTGSVSDDDKETINFGAGGPNIEDMDGSGGTGEISLESIMGIKGTPVLDDAGLYKAYRDFARSYLAKGPTLADEDPLMHEMSIRTVGTRVERTYYWIPRTVKTAINGRTETVQVRPKLDALLDRVMLDQKKDKESTLRGSADMLVMSVEAKGRVEGGAPVRWYEMSAAPGIDKLVYGQLKLESKGERHIVATCTPDCVQASPDGVTQRHCSHDLEVVKESASVTGLLVPHSAAGDGSVAEGLSRLKFYLAAADAKRLAGMKGVNCERSCVPGCATGSCPVDEVVVSLVQSKMHSVAYKDSKNSAVDLNETVVALVKFLNKANGEGG